MEGLQSINTVLLLLLYSFVVAAAAVAVVCDTNVEGHP
jgi:hypothetical protein